MDGLSLAPKAGRETPSDRHILEGLLRKYGVAVRLANKETSMSC